jgi:hypothetical protein
MRRIGPCFGGALEVIFQPNDSSSKGREVLHIHADAAPVFKNTSLQPFPRGPDDHLEPAFLSCSPNIGGFAA